MYDEGVDNLDNWIKLDNWNTMMIQQDGKTIKKRILLMCMMVVMIPGVATAALTISSVGTLDSGGSARTTFSSTEKISFSIKVNNTVASSGRVQFSFFVKDPAGRRVLTQTGNSAPGLVGASGADIKSHCYSFISAQWKQKSDHSAVNVSLGWFGCNPVPDICWGSSVAFPQRVY